MSSADETCLDCGHIEGHHTRKYESEQRGEYLFACAYKGCDCQSYSTWAKPESPKCRECEKDALGHSYYCEDHAPRREKRALRDEDDAAGLPRNVTAACGHRTAAGPNGEHPLRCALCQPPVESSPPRRCALCNATLWKTTTSGEVCPSPWLHPAVKFAEALIHDLGDALPLAARDRIRDDFRLAASTTTARWRPQVRALADAMEAKLRANDHKGDWRRHELTYLLKRLRQEAAELAEHPWDLGEAADCANFSMFVVDKAGGLKPDSEK